LAMGDLNLDRCCSRSISEQPINRSQRSSLKMIFDNPFDHEYNSRPLATDQVLTGMTLMV